MKKKEKQREKKEEGRMYKFDTETIHRYNEIIKCERAKRAKRSGKIRFLFSLELSHYLLNQWANQFQIYRAS